MALHSLFLASESCRYLGLLQKTNGNTNTEKCTHIHASNGTQIYDAKVRALAASTNMQGHWAL